MGAYDTRGGSPLHDPSVDRDEQCLLCRRDAYDCTCQECKVCGVAGDPACLGKHIHAARYDLFAQGYYRGYAAFFAGAKRTDADVIYKAHGQRIGGNINRARGAGWICGFDRAKSGKPLDDSNG